MILRQGVLDRIRTALARAPVDVLTGPRQCGKATLARTEPDSFAWRKQFIQTLLERDLPQWW